MMYWYSTAQEIDSLYQLERLKVHYYGKITGIQANSYETLQSIYDNKTAIEKETKNAQDAVIGELKKRNRSLVVNNIILSIGVGSLAFSTIYFAIF
jgi:hypothetical protein